MTTQTMVNLLGIPLLKLWLFDWKITKQIMANWLGIQMHKIRLDDWEYHYTNCD